MYHVRYTLDSTTTAEVAALLVEMTYTTCGSSGGGSLGLTRGGAGRALLGRAIRRLRMGNNNIIRTREQTLVMLKITVANPRLIHVWSSNLAKAYMYKDSNNELARTHMLHSHAGAWYLRCTMLWRHLLLHVTVHRPTGLLRVVFWWSQTQTTVNSIDIDIY